MLLVLALALLFALATAAAGWLAVPALGLAFGATWGMRDARPAGLRAAAAAALGWAALLAVAAARGPVWALAGRLAGVLAVPPAALVLVTLAYAALLGGTAAVVGRAVGARVHQRRAAAADRARAA